MTDDLSPQPKAGTAPPVGDDGLIDVDSVLSAFSTLLAQNARVERLVATHFGIGTTDLKCLVFVSNNPESTPKSAAESLELSTGATTSLIDRLENAGFVSRRAHPTDRRSVVLELAPAGEAAVAETGAFYRSAFRDAIDPRQLDFLTSVMRAIGDSLTRRAADDGTTGAQPAR
jgi:DNA-binding MarR family transcriptional regulator